MYASVDRGAHHRRDIEFSRIPGAAPARFMVYVLLPLACEVEVLGTDGLHARDKLYLVLAITHRVT
jgi:hypothetical protein